MKQTVTPGDQTTTVALDGSECEVIFGSRYNVFSVEAENDVVVALESGKKAGDDGTLVCKGGGSLAYDHMKMLDRVYLTGSGKVQVIASNNAAVGHFKKAPKGGDGHIETWDLSYVNTDSGIVSGFINNAQFGACGYNLYSDWEKNRLCISKENSSYGISHFDTAVDLTNVKEIVITGAIKSNLNGLTANAYYLISDTVTNTFTKRDWTPIKSTVGTALVEFSVEIGCTRISGEKYLHIAIEHGAEAGNYTGFLYLDKIDFVYLKGGSRNESHMIYNQGKDMNGHTVSVYHTNSSSGKFVYGIHVHYWYGGVVITDLLDLRGYHRIGAAIRAVRKETAYPANTGISIYNNNEVTLGGSDYWIPNAPITDRIIVGDVNDNITNVGGIFYVDIPEGVNSGYFGMNTVNFDVDVYSIWLE